MDIAYRYDYQRQSRAALERTKVKLEGLVEAASKLGRTKEAESIQKDVEAIEAWMAQPHIPEPAEAPVTLRGWLRVGFAMLAHNFLTAVGTVNALGRPEVGEDFKAEGTAIEGMLLPILDEQIGLALVDQKAAAE